MTVTIKIEINEPLDLALKRLRKKVKSEMDRRWYKRRFGYYEKPSALKRKSKKMKKLAIQSGGLKEQFLKKKLVRPQVVSHAIGRSLRSPPQTLAH